MSSQSFSSTQLRKKLFASLLVFTTSWALLAIPGCSEDSPPQTTDGAISGRVIVPPNHVLEAEPNDSPDAAQAIGQATRVSGEADANDPGFELPGEGVEAQDLYRVTTTVPVRVTLVTGANELSTYDPERDPAIEVTVDRSGLADGSYMGTVQIATDATEGSSSADVNVAMTVGEVDLGDAGPTIVRILDAETFEVATEVVTDASQGYAYTTGVIAPGT